MNCQWRMVLLNPGYSSFNPQFKEMNVRISGDFKNWSQVWMWQGYGCAFDDLVTCTGCKLQHPEALSWIQEYDWMEWSGCFVFHFITGFYFFCISLKLTYGLVDSDLWHPSGANVAQYLILHSSKWHASRILWYTLMQATRPLFRCQEPASLLTVFYHNSVNQLRLITLFSSFNKKTL